ncbi:hypothetical protein D9M68_752440 [compost metagenome]
MATSTGTWACTAAVFSFIASSCSRRSTCSALDSASRITPVPLQRGQVMCEPSFRAGRRRWRDSSIRPKRDILPIWTRARSKWRASRRRCSTARWFLLSSMSMKSMTIKPPRSRRRSWRATSSAASELVRSAVSSMSAPRVERAELTSTDTSASVWSMTMAPPEGSCTVREYAVSIWCSIWKREKSGMSSR